MTTWGNWHYSSSNGARLGWDAFYSNGNKLNLVISIQTQNGYDSDNYQLRWTSPWGNGTTAFTPLSIAAGQVKVLLTKEMGTQAYNSTVTVGWEILGLNDGAKPTLTAVVPLGPARPNMPTLGAVTRVSDSQVNINWTNNATTDGPIDANHIIRSDEANNYVGVGQTSGTATSFTDTTTSPNHRYRYSVVAKNSSGTNSTSPSDPPLYTTPAAPINVVAVKTSSGDIRLTWDASPCSYVDECSVSFEETTNGGVSWAPLGSMGATNSSWTHTAPSASLPHRYRARTVAPSGVSSSGALSNTVSLLVRPNTPTNQGVSAQYPSSTSPAVGDASGTITLSWQHNPADSSAQTAYEVGYQVSVNGGSTWGAESLTGKVSSNTSSRTFAANTFPNNLTIRWRVRTWGLYTGPEPSFSDWTGYSTFYTNARPTATLTGPTTWNSSTLTQVGTYGDVEGTSQTGARWALKSNTGVVLESASVGSSEPAKLLSYTFATRVGDGTSYIVTFATRDGVGLWSSEATKTLTVTYPKPSTPILSLVYNDESGSVLGQITNPTGGVAAAYNMVYRNGKLIAGMESLPPNGSFMDPLPPLGSLVSYTVIAVSSLPSSSLPGAQSVDTSTKKVWLNTGPGMSTRAYLDKRVSIEIDRNREKTLGWYDGRSKPVQYSGIAVSRRGTVSGVAYHTELSALIDVVENPAIGCFRDPRGGKMFVSFTKMEHSDGSANVVLVPVTINMEEVDYDE